MKKHLYILSFFFAILLGSSIGFAQTTVLSQNFEGAFTVIGTTGGSWTTVPDGAPVNTPAGGQWWYSSGASADNLWHRNDFCGAWSSCNDITGGADQPPSAGAGGSSHSLLFNIYNAASGSYGSIQSNAINLSPYVGCGASLTFYYCDFNTASSNLTMWFYNGSAWVQAGGTLSNTGNGWVAENFAVPASCLIATTYLLVQAQSDYYYYPIGVDEIVVAGNSCCTPPTTQATGFTSSVICGVSETIGWTRGNGNDVMVVARAGGASTAPSSGTVYTANTVYGAGTACGGGFCVYNGTGTSVTVTGLSAGTTYYYDIYEYNTAGTCYKTPSLSGNAMMSTNDNWACASILSVGTAANAQTTAGASLEANESIACNTKNVTQTLVVDQSVWYKFVATSTHSYVQINMTAGGITCFGATIWGESSTGSSYQVDANRYCGMITCQSMAWNVAATNPFLYDLCHLIVGNTYYVQVVHSTSCSASATFNILVTNANPGGTITNPCQPDGQASNFLTSPIPECYINACVTAPACPVCATYTLNGAGGENQDNIVWNSYYSFTTAGGCSNDLEFQQCVTAQAGAPCNSGNVDYLAWQLYDATGTTCITSGDFSTSTDVYGYLGIPGVGCTTSYVLQYTTEQINCQYWYFTPFTDNYGSSTCTLPIELIHFTATENDKGIIDLNWATASETNDNYYTLERSIDAKTFTGIGKVKGVGNSTQTTNYTYVDTSATELTQNVLYYRLSQTDFNGATNTFNVVEVNRTRNFSVSVYPNPSTGNFNLDFSSAAGNFIQVDLLDATGAVISSKLYMGSGSLQHQKIEPPQSGVYFMNIKIGDQVIHKKIVKL